MDDPLPFSSSSLCACNDPYLICPMHSLLYMFPLDDGQLELAMRCGKVRRLHPIALNSDGMFQVCLGKSPLLND